MRYREGRQPAVNQPPHFRKTTSELGGELSKAPRARPVTANEAAFVPGGPSASRVEP